MSDVPARLGRYQIVKHLANGGMAQVLVARARGIEGFERHVVIKRIHGDRAADPVFVQMFLDEARLAAQLHHNNIVQVHDIGKAHGEYFFAMEYVHGEDVRKLLMKLSKQRTQMPIEHVVTIVATAALALHHAHEQRGADRKPLGIVHRDVSPANIIVGYDGTVKVLDFGIAKAALRGKPEDTKDNALKGKASYMAPEQCSGQGIDRRSDVFALGIVLFELVTVRRLFKGANDFLTMSAIVSGHVPKPSAYRPELPPELEAIMLKALALEPADRYQTAEEMREALEAFGSDKGLRMSTGALAGYMKQVFGSRPEPWLVEEPVEYEVSVDFDGSESGAAKPDAVPATLEPRPSSPLQRARKKATNADALLAAYAASAAAAARAANDPEDEDTIALTADDAVAPHEPELPQPLEAASPGSASTSGLADGTTLALTTDAAVPPPMQHAARELALPVPHMPPMHESPAGPAGASAVARMQPTDGSSASATPGTWRGGAAATGSSVPLAWPMDATRTSAPVTRRRLFAIAGGVVGLAIAIVLVLARGNEHHIAATPARVLSSPPTPAVIVQPPPPPPPPAPVPEPVVEAPKPAPKIEAAPVKRVAKKKKPQWNPDELFLPEAKK